MSAHLTRQAHLTRVAQQRVARRSSARGRACVCVRAESGVLGKIGRVFEEKVKRDFNKVFDGTAKTRQTLGIVDELLTYWNLDDAEDTLEELEDALIAADFGPTTALKVVDGIRDDVLDGKLRDAAAIRAGLRDSLKKTLKESGGDTALNLTGAPSVILVVGVNGAGKTTTIGKLASRFIAEGAQVTLGAGDTFRAAAAEQLGEWASRSGAAMGPFHQGARPGSILGQTIDQAVEAGAGASDVVICDTSGRLHTDIGLMDELAKCKKMISKRMDGAPHEVLLVLDGTTGLNMLNQAREFHDAVGLDGLILTKLDGSARGGAVVSVVDALKVPVKFIGVGEQVDDLIAFDPDSFVDSLFPDVAA